MKTLTHALASAAVAALLFAAPAFAGGDKVLVELFTSQGCSSCPPADALMGELAERDDVIPLSFHVDYWNYLGWKDPFSSHETTQRQRDYQPRLGKRYVYTPQMVIGGRRDTVGSHRGAVLQAIEDQRRFFYVPIAVTHPTPDQAVITVGKGDRPARPATVWLFAYDRRHVTEIRRGENEGVTLVNTNVVRKIRRIGTWNGKATTIRVTLNALEIKGQDRCAVVVQGADLGPVIGAADFPLPGKSG